MFFYFIFLSFNYNLLLVDVIICLFDISTALKKYGFCYIHFAKVIQTNFNYKFLPHSFNGIFLFFLNIYSHLSHSSKVKKNEVSDFHQNTSPEYLFTYFLFLFLNSFFSFYYTKRGPRIIFITTLFQYLRRGFRCNARFFLSYFI